jgi:hypothetical protein
MARVGVLREGVGCGQEQSADHKIATRFCHIWRCRRACARRRTGWVQLKEGSNVPVSRAAPAPASDTTLSP